jgi:hypothetical protein
MFPGAGAAATVPPMMKHTLRQKSFGEMEANELQSSSFCYGGFVSVRVGDYQWLVDHEDKHAAPSEKTAKDCRFDLLVLRACSREDCLSSLEGSFEAGAGGPYPRLTRAAHSSFEEGPFSEAATAAATATSFDYGEGTGVEQRLLRLSWRSRLALSLWHTRSESPDDTSFDYDPVLGIKI